MAVRKIASKTNCALIDFFGAPITFLRPISLDLLLDLAGGLKKLVLFALALAFFSGGFLAGARNDLIMTCHDFELAGSMLPNNCMRQVIPGSP